MPKISENTGVEMPIRNLLSIILAVAVGVWAYFGIIERLNKLETDITLMSSDLEKNTEFRIKWPRGDMGSLPADAEQFMLIEHLAGQLEKLANNIETYISYKRENEVSPMDLRPHPHEFNLYYDV